MEIQLIKGTDIDRLKWDSCVHYATNGNIFGYQWFLNNTAREWDGLVEGDYESVMPLIYRESKSAPTELYLPDFIREAGVYSVNLPSAKRVQGFLDAIPSQYKHCLLSLNERTSLPETTSSFDKAEQTNYQMLLTDPYDKMADQYSSDFLRALEKASQQNYISTTSVKPEKLVDFFRQHAPQYFPADQQYFACLRLIYNALHRGRGFINGLLDNAGQLKAAGMFFFSHNKMISLMVAAPAQEIDNGALAYLADLLLRSNAGRPLLFDLNWQKSNWPLSIVEGIGASATPYFHLHKDQRQWWEKFWRK